MPKEKKETKATKKIKKVTKSVKKVKKANKKAAPKNNISQYYFLIAIVAIIFIAFVWLQKSHYFERSICADTLWQWNNDFNTCEHGFMETYKNQAKKK